MCIILARSVGNICTRSQDDTVGTNKAPRAPASKTKHPQNNSCCDTMQPSYRWVFCGHVDSWLRMSSEREDKGLEDVYWTQKYTHAAEVYSLLFSARKIHDHFPLGNQPVCLQLHRSGILQHVTIVHRSPNSQNPPRNPNIFSPLVENSCKVIRSKFHQKSGLAGN